ncbi:MAG: SRPBCC domain-containing protein [Gammaproteobacteria bacterium]|nr:SRPBCC domain-containing protein [Gammaproteobacteria bacterium]
MASTDEFQNIPDTVTWKLHFASPPEKVYDALATDDGRAGYWAESAIETDGKIHYVFLNGIEDTGSIIERERPGRFKVTYFSWTVTFDIDSDGMGGSDMTVTCVGVKDEDKRQMVAGWVSWLMAMKAAVDFDVDLRNHDPERTWFHGYADN